MQILRTLLESSYLVDFLHRLHYSGQVVAYLLRECCIKHGFHHIDGGSKLHRLVLLVLLELLLRHVVEDVELKMLHLVVELLSLSHVKLHFLIGLGELGAGSRRFVGYQVQLVVEVQVA